MHKLIMPKTYVETERPLIFLAGPIENAPKWHAKAIKLIVNRYPEVIIAVPVWNRAGFASYNILEGDDSRFPRSRLWELHYMDHASTNGAVLFWLPGPGKITNPKKVYGAMTRVDIGEMIERYRGDKTTRFCVGTNGKFPEFHTIECDLSVRAPDIPIRKTLRETCEDAIELARMVRK